MKHIFTLSVTTLLILASLWGYSNPYTVTVTSPGELQQTVNTAVGGSQNYNLITELTVIGTLNGADLTFLQDLGYGPNNGGLGLLQFLDITQANFPQNTMSAFLFAQTWIENIQLPNSVELYEWQCFFNSKVKYIRIGTSTNEIYEDPTINYSGNDYTAFSNAKEMVAYEVAADNPYFTAIDGVIYTKDMKVLVSYPSNKPDNSFTIEENVEKIIFDAFGHSRNLRSVTMPNSLKYISDYGFSACQELNTINWGTGLEKIGYSAFMTVTGMGEVVLPEGLTTLGYGAFFNAQLTKVTGPSSLVSIAPDSFRGDGLDGSSLITLDFSNCSKLYEIPDACFYDNFKLKNILLPEGLIVVGPSSFQNCYAIEDLVIPNSVERIEENAFWMFSELYEHKMKTVILGNNLQSINGYAFGECKKITEIRTRNVVPPALANDGFEAFLNSRATLYVPIGTVNDYKAANRWKDFLTIVEETTTDVKYNLEPPAKVYTSGNFVVIENAVAGQEIRVYSTNGALISNSRLNSSTMRFTLKPGAYIVTIGAHSTKVVL